MARYQKREIEARPRCPLHSGLNAEGRMGSSTTASSVNTASQASLSRAPTASRDRRPASWAGWADVTGSMVATRCTRLAPRLRSPLVLPTGVNVGVGVALHRVLLLVQWRVEGQPVENP